MDNQPPPTLLMTDPLRLPVEELVSQHTGREWRVREARDLKDYACHPAAILSDGSQRVFVKFSNAANGQEQFEVELAGLRLLAACAGVWIPTPIGILTVEGGALLALEAVAEVERGSRHWQQIGQTLARIHRVKGARFGLETQGYFGPLYQDNRPLPTWAAFYTERRLLPRLMGAVNSGNLPTSAIHKVEKLLARFAELCGPEPRPTLLHGDAQQNNYISTADGTYVIDPAVYYGHPEYDLALLDCYHPVPEEVFHAYRDEQPLAADFNARRDLYHIGAYLAGVEVEGSGYLPLLLAALDKYV